MLFRRRIETTYSLFSSYSVVSTLRRTAFVAVQVYALRLRGWEPPLRSGLLNHLLGYYRGTSTCPNRRWMTASASRPSISASGLSKMR